MRRIKYLIMDVDGTLTDGKVYMGNDGEVFKAFDIKDGFGIHDILIPADIEPIIVTGRISKIVLNRSKELGVEQCYQGVGNKLLFIKGLLERKGDSLSNVAYIGDDLNDLECMNEVNLCGGETGCPSDAVEAIKEISCFICRRRGGEGAVREFIEHLLNN